MPCNEESRQNFFVITFDGLNLIRDDDITSLFFFEELGGAKSFNQINSFFMGLGVISDRLMNPF